MVHILFLALNIDRIVSVIIVLPLFVHIVCVWEINNWGQIPCLCMNILGHIKLILIVLALMHSSMNGSDEHLPSSKWDTASRLYGSTSQALDSGSCTWLQRGSTKTSLINQVIHPKSIMKGKRMACKRVFQVTLHHSATTCHRSSLSWLCDPSQMHG